jgi:predicted RNA-binding Zn-ribbon protein involved in translation (DUF1610 family)
MAFVDERALARNFKTGDVVQKASLRDLLPAPYYGRVLFANAETGVVTVQWPWGAEQEYPSTLNPVLAKDVKNILDLNQWYSNWDAAKHGMYGDEPDPGYSALSARVASLYEQKTLPMWRVACKLMHYGFDEIEAFKVVSKEFSDEFGPDAVRRTVANLYEASRRMAVYWNDPKRKYRVTRRERETGVFTCPRCKGTLRPRTFRQNQKVLSCRACGFTIHPEDLVK